MNRVLQAELLDTLPPDDPRVLRTRRDLRRVNAWMRNHVIMADALRTAANGRAPKQITDLGAGDGHFLLRVAQKIFPAWPDVNVTLLDRREQVSAETLAAFANVGWHARGVVADVFDWPQSDSDIVVANLFLHHLENERLAELFRVVASRAQLFVAIEPRRTPWTLSWCRWLWVIGCGAVTRHDAVLSVRAGFSETELSALWPAEQGWQLNESRIGFFSHLFVARKIPDSAGVPPAIPGVAPENRTP